ncbi:lysylphosphatidylglycerol synthase transmembrane domain-containing protein [Candidatus Leptofilum sp.]|uniref:lysylphosphatidylglycerol synthase transmembrane domain-containing protein n=1 Tax=Candidatus Leptofilum sp. TaxID=3241576 RepID=UPI003B592F7F
MTSPEASTTPPAKTKNRLVTLLKVGITLISLAFVFTNVPLSEIGDGIRQARWGWLFVAMLINFAGLVLRSVRWAILLNGIGSTVPLPQLIKLYFVGAFFNGVLPSGFGGDVVRIIEVAEDVPQATAAGTVLVDRLSGLMGLFVLGLLVMAFNPDVFPQEILLQVGGVCLLGLVGGVFLLRGWRWFPFLENLLNKLPQQVARPFLKLIATLQALPTRSLLQALGISLLFNFLLIGQWTAVSRGLNFTISYWYLMGVVPVMAIALLAPSFSGLGVRELIAPLLFAGAGLATAQAVTLSLMVFFVKRASELVGAPIYLISLWRKRP